MDKLISKQLKSMILKKKYWQNNAFLQHSQCQQTK